tara:strand:+ start:23315 stop:24004 length:690 start_codon:yes stop_codon:yes gene_type:complete
MKVSGLTIEIMKNFAAINSSLYFKQGKKLRTISRAANILAEADIEEDVPQEFAIYDMPGFLATLGGFASPEFIFDDDESLLIEDSVHPERKAKYHFCDKDLIKIPPEKDLALPDEHVKFSLTSENFRAVSRMAGVLDVEEIVVLSDGGKLKMGATNIKDEKSNQFFTELSDTDLPPFRATFKAESLLLIEAPYDVTISSAGLSKFTCTDSKYPGLTYWIANDANTSEFE